MSPLLSSRSRCCCCHPLNLPALASPRSALIQSPHLFGETILSQLWTTSLLNFCSTCVPLPHNSVLKVFLVLSVFMFIIIFDPHDTYKLDKAVIIPILEMRKPRPSKVQGFAKSLMPDKTQIRPVNFWFWFQAFSVALSYSLGYLFVGMFLIYLLPQTHT